MTVVDASVVVVALTDLEPWGPAVRERLVLADELLAPHVLDLEVASAVRRKVRERKMTGRAGAVALAGLEALPLERYPHAPFIGRIWELRHDLTPYDAAYVALAEALDMPLVTMDAALASVRKLGCRIELLR
jgi:predicted nucleic acid-binding protein